MEKIKLTIKEREEVQGWLDLSPSEQERRCPFSWEYNKGERRRCCKICFSWFPRLRHIQAKGVKFPCPCTVYELKYVRHRVKQMMKYQ